MNPDRFDSNRRVPDDAIQEIALRWLLERDEGLDPERAAAFAAWCAADARHAAAVAQVERGLALLEQMPAVRAPLEAEVAADARRVAKSARPRRVVAWAMGLAAALVFVAWLSFTRWAGDERYATAAAPREVALRDGSIVNVNAHSEVAVRWTTRERNVTLRAGEAHFDVAHDPARPFVVRSGGVAIRAVGTAFNVRASSDGVEVVVIEGRVEVARVPKREATGATATSGPLPAPLVAAGERAWVARAAPDEAKPRIEKVDPRVLRETLAWHGRVMSFSDRPLREVVAQFNRRNATQLVLADEALGTRKIGGTFALENLEAFLRLLELDGEIAIERRGESEVVLRRAR